MKKLILTGLSCAIAALLSAQTDLLLQMEFLLDGQFREVNSKDLYYFSGFDVYGRNPIGGMALDPGISGTLLIKRDTNDGVEIYNLFGLIEPMPEEIILTSFASNSKAGVEWILKKLNRDTIVFDNRTNGTDLTLIKDQKKPGLKTCFFDGAYWKRVPAESAKDYELSEPDSLVFTFKKYQKNGRHWGFGNYFYKTAGEEAIRIASHSGFSYNVIRFAGGDYLLMCWEDCILYKILKVEEDKITLLSSEQKIEIFYKTKDW